MATQGLEELEVTLRNGLLIIQFNRPRKRNAFNAQVL
jgi:enoyl-CoA hydratase/carnithine racemase